MPRTRQSEQTRRRLFGAIVAGWIVCLASMLVGLFDGPDTLRDVLMLVGLIAVVAVVGIAMRTR